LEIGREKLIDANIEDDPGPLHDELERSCGQAAVGRFPLSELQKRVREPSGR
jgi:hypothetical protein